MLGKPGTSAAAKLFHRLIDVDLDRAAQHRAPGLYIGLKAGVAGDALAVELERFRGVVFDLLDVAGRVVDVLQQAHARAPECLEERRRRLDHRQQMRRIRVRQREFELQRSADRPSFFLGHRTTADSMARGGGRRQCYWAMPNRASADASAGGGARPDVKAMRAVTGARALAPGPIRSTTRRAIAGAGSI